MNKKRKLNLFSCPSYGAASICPRRPTHRALRCRPAAVLDVFVSVQLSISVRK
jgi:hypothetical protein